MKIPKLLVDNLRHISDHGLAVEFSDPKLKAMVDGLKKDGRTRLEAGQSRLDIITVGRVTFTHLYLAHGSYNIKNAHYFDEPSALKFRHQESQDGHAHDTLKAVILGGGMPNVWGDAMRCGKSQDELRDWLKKWAWTLAGESGMRACAIKAGRDKVEEEVKTLTQRIENANRNVAIFDKRDFDAEVSAKHTMTFKFLKRSQGDEAKVSEELEKAIADPAKMQYQNTFGLVNRWSGTTSVSTSYRWQIPGRDGEWSHPRITPNYTATRNGEEIRLSSGMVCDVTASQALAWLKGEGPAPTSRYGNPRLVEAATNDQQPIIIVECGCHRLDLRNLGDDFAEALRPKHTVVVSNAVPTLYWDTDKEACIASMRARADAMIKDHREARSNRVREFKQERAALHDLRDHKAERLADMRSQIEAEKMKLVAAEKAVEDFDQKVLTRNSDETIKQMILACNALAGIRIQ